MAINLEKIPGIANIHFDEARAINSSNSQEICNRAIGCEHFARISILPGTSCPMFVHGISLGTQRISDNQKGETSFYGSLYGYTQLNGDRCAVISREKYSDQPHLEVVELIPEKSISGIIMLNPGQGYAAAAK